MNIKVCGISMATSLFSEYQNIISVVNKPANGWAGSSVEAQHEKHLIVSFHDVEDDAEGFDSPTRDHIQHIVNTVRSWNLTDETPLLIHCTAGKSRSTAIAIAVLVMQGKSIQNAIEITQTLSPAMCPNRLMIEYFDEVLELGGSLKQAISDWYEEKILFIPGLFFPNRGGYNR